MFGVHGRKHLTQERRENSMLRAEQSRAELGRNLIFPPEVMLCHF